MPSSRSSVASRRCSWSRTASRLRSSPARTCSSSSRTAARAELGEKDWGFATRALHIGQGPDLATGAVVQPIHLATTFAQQGVGKHQGFEYSRSGNPTRAALEECMAGLEEGKACLAFSSGLGAETTLMMLLNP